MSKVCIVLNVNGQDYEAYVKQSALLVDVLREDLSLTGTKKGCGEGTCGSCSVIIDGKAVNSCLIYAITAQGKKITTIEGISEPGQLHPLQQSFINEGAIQCGYCTPGMIMTAKALLDSNPSPSEKEIRKGMAGNLCRCTGYTKIVKAVQNVNKQQTSVK